MGNFADAPMKKEGEAISYDEYRYGVITPPTYVVHMKAKGRWQMLTWSGKSQKYRVVSEYPTERQARAIKILMEK